MLRKKILLPGLMLLLSLALIHCKEEIHGPTAGANIAPEAVSNLKVINLHGAAKVAYKVPSDPDLFYVEADWTYKGVARNAKSSYYSDTLTIDGFGDTLACTVQIYSVNRSEKRSNPVTVTVKPLSAPVQDVFKSLQVKPDFGGINVSYINAASGNVVITVLTKDKNGDLKNADTEYTGLKAGNFSTRGFDATPTVFGIFVKDRWNNISDTLYTTQTPLFELQLNKSLFKELNPYPGDVNADIYSASYPMRNLWDNSTGTIFVTKTNLGMPESFTIDLGVKATLSRFKYYQRQSTAFYFTSGTPNVWDIYGSNNPPSDGSYSGWALLMHCASVKPSGLPLGTVSNDDVAQAQNGEDFTFPTGSQGYRYLRFKITQTYGNATNITFSELTFWGAY